MATEPPAPRVAPRWWVASAYFAEGYPYTVIHNLADVLFKEMGASLQIIGLTSLFHLPWNLKFLWGPFLDSHETKRRWLLACEVALTVLLLALALTTTLPQVLGAAAAVFLLMALVAATHDIAVDGYYLEALDARAQSRFVGYRAAAYRLAMVAVSGPLLLTIGKIGWFAGLGLTALGMAALTSWHAYALPATEVRGRPARDLARSLWRGKVLRVAALAAIAIAAARAGWQLAAVQAAVAALVGAIVEQAPWVAKLGVADAIGLGLLALLAGAAALAGRLRRAMQRSKSAYGAAFVDFLDQPKVGRILAFIVLYRTGESFLTKMRFPFLRDAGMTVAEYGFANGTVGILASFAGTIVGGHFIARDGLRRWLWPFVLAQNVLNLLFAGAAWYAERHGNPGINALTSVIATEHFGAGLGTAVFMVYLMRCCRPAHRAAHMAIVTALMSVSFTVAGAFSGYLADSMGFAAYFAFTFVATFPAMALLPGLPHLDPAAVDPKGP